MSSRPPDAPAPSRWPRWRVSMLVGSVILLGASIADAAVDDLARPLYVVPFVAGYLLLTYGFFSAMKLRHAQKKKEQSPKRPG